VAAFAEQQLLRARRFSWAPGRSRYRPGFGEPAILSPQNRRGNATILLTRERSFA